MPSEEEVEQVPRPAKQTRRTLTSVQTKLTVEQAFPPKKQKLGIHRKNVVEDSSNSEDDSSEVSEENSEESEEDEEEAEPGKNELIFKILVM